MKSISGVRMRTPSVESRDYVENSAFLLSLSICFSPFLYYLSQNVTREKRKLKEVMKTMGLHDAAFWLSWGLPYAGIILIMSFVMAFFLQAVYCSRSSFSVLFLLLFLYGISSVSFLAFISSFGSNSYSVEIVRVKIWRKLR
uniref:ABC-2 type transporter transmembrane domain-containing protein n=1 Tax=Salvator merianae TaxID=96440 RepID=A0A8D0C016_SALMN